MTESSLPRGWYSYGSGNERYWTGTEWTRATRPLTPGAIGWYYPSGAGLQWWNGASWDAPRPAAEEIIDETLEPEPVTDEPGPAWPAPEDTRPGWYPQPDGLLHWWTGRAWTYRRAHDTCMPPGIYKIPTDGGADLTMTWDGYRWDSPYRNAPMSAPTAQEERRALAAHSHRADNPPPPEAHQLARPTPGLFGGVRDFFKGNPAATDNWRGAGHNPSFDACMWRRNSRCYFTTTLDDDASETVDAPIWDGRDQGWCPHVLWDAQRDCRHFEPGMNDGGKPSGFTWELADGSFWRNTEHAGYRRR